MSQVQWFYEENGSRVGPVTEEAIKDLLQGRRIGHGTLVWRSGLPEWVAVEASELNEELVATPPPLDKKHISGLWVWLLACSPLLWLYVPERSELGASLVIGVLGIFLCALDIRKIRRAGYKAPSIWWSLFIPGYFFVRSQVLKLNYAPLIVWLVLIVLPYW